MKIPNIRNLTLASGLLLSMAGAVLAAPSSAELLQNEVIAMVDSAELNAAGDKDAEAFRKALVGNATWQRELLDSGPVGNAKAVTAMLFEIWKSDKDLVNRPVDRGMATACALEGVSRALSAEQVLERYNYFRVKYKAGLLNVMYKDLSVFERRYIARGVQHWGFNSIASMQYQNEEVCLPAEKYTGACWYAQYQLHNAVGDSIHGPNYYRLFANAYGSHSEMVHKVGGVCGSLSNFGASAALANGVPALTMGEPGHCAYAVMVKAKTWRPAYSLSWKRGTHTSFYGSTWGWHMYNTRAHENQQAIYAAGDALRLAAYYSKHDQRQQARDVLAAARKKYPLEWKLWEASGKMLQAQKVNELIWQEFHKDVLKHLAPVSGEVAFHTLRTYVYPAVLPKGKEGIAKRRLLLLGFHKSVKDWGLARWNFSGALSSHIKLLGGNVAQQDSYMNSVFKAHVSHDAFVADVLSYQLGRVEKDDKRRQSFIASMGKSLSSSKGDNFGKVVDQLAARILPDAAKKGDKASFQYIGKLTKKNYAECNVKPEPFPGILLSSGGIFQIQQPGNRYDSPARHWGVIEEHGGSFHTAAKPATATVRLGNHGRISGVVIVLRAGRTDRIVGSKLQVSANGKDWKDVHTFKIRNRVHRVDLSKQKINAGFVRVYQPNHPSLHFNKLLIYGKKQN